MKSVKAAMVPGKAHNMSLHPQYRLVGTAGSRSPLGRRFDCQDAAAAQRCYEPQQMRKAYDITRILNAGYKGKGETIVIIDAFQSPTIEHDLKAFDALFGLNDPDFKIIAPDGVTPFDATSPEHIIWSDEISLDVEWAHAIAPSASIVLVLARSGQDKDIVSALRYAVEHNLGDVISQSYGEAEVCMDPQILRLQHQLFQKATEQGITLLASSGDSGAAQPNCDNTSYLLSPGTPASDPLVTAVGGTYLNADGNTGEYFGEAAWNDGYGSSGGGVSYNYALPAYQKGFAATRMRSVPDISYDASVNSGVLVVWSSSGLGMDKVFTIGGTSAGSPQWAGIVALIDEFIAGRVGFINGILYQRLAKSGYQSFFHDTTVGNNTYSATTRAGAISISGYNTNPGWDTVTGLGSLTVSSTIFNTRSMQWTKWSAHSSDAADLLVKK